MSKIEGTLAEAFPRWWGSRGRLTDREYGQLAFAIEARLTGPKPVAHPMFGGVLEQLESSACGCSLTLLMGLSGVGKTRLLEALVRRCWDGAGDGAEVPAVFMVAPTAQRQSFSWKAFWQRYLTQLHEPLPHQKMHPGDRAARSRAGLPARSTTEAQYFEMALDAARQRGLQLLVIDEAIALARSEKGRTLVDQIHVLRELADQRLFRIVLGSTFDILPHFRRAGVLERRLGTVLFPRYIANELSSEDSRGPAMVEADPAYQAVCGTAKTFMERLPVGGRYAFTSEEYFGVYRASLGCVGLLCDLFVRAVARCVVAGEERLAWPHFAQSVLSVSRRATLVAEAHAAAEQIKFLEDMRLDLDESQLLAVARMESRQDARRIAPRTPPRQKKKRGGRRPGKPNPRAMQLP